MDARQREYMVRQTVEQVGLQIERAMRASRLTTRQLALRAGLDALYLDDIIHGRADCDIDTLADIASAMKLRWVPEPRLAKLAPEASAAGA